MPEQRQVKKNKLKVVRKDTFELNDWDKYVISGMAVTMDQLKQTIAAHQAMLQLLETSLGSTQTSITDYLASVAVQRWDFEKGPEIAFEDFSIEDGKVTVVQYEANDVPKDAAETNDANEKSAEPAGAETGSEAETEAQAA